MTKVAGKQSSVLIFMNRFAVNFRNFTFNFKLFVVDKQ